MRSFSPERKPTIRLKTEAESLEKLQNKEKTLVDKFQGIVAQERLKKKMLESQIYKITEENQEIEKKIQQNIQKIKTEIDRLKTEIQKSFEKLEKLKKEVFEYSNEHDKQMKSLKQQTTVELLFKDLGKQKKNLTVGEESQYLINKERIRLIKQELLKTNQEKMETYKFEVLSTETFLETLQFQRQKLKKEFKIQKEQISILYFKILKDGKDLRTEGLK